MNVIHLEQWKIPLVLRLENAFAKKAMQETSVINAQLPSSKQLSLMKLHLVLHVDVKRVDQLMETVMILENANVMMS